MGDTLAGCCGLSPSTGADSGTSQNSTELETEENSGSEMNNVQSEEKEDGNDESKGDNTEDQPKKKDRLVSKEALSRARLDQMEKLIDALSAMEDVELPMELIRMIMRFSSAAVYTWDRKRTFFLDIRGNTVSSKAEGGMVGWSLLNHAWSKKHKPKVFGIVCTKVAGKIRVGVSESTNAVGAAYKVVAVHSNKNPVKPGTQIFCEVDLKAGVFRVQTADMRYDRTMEFKSEVGYPVHGMVILHPGSAVTLLDIDEEQQEQIERERQMEEAERQLKKTSDQIERRSSLWGMAGDVLIRQGSV